MPHYENACIYKIKHNEDYDDKNIYIGSTCDVIKRRCHHKSSCNNENNKGYNIPVYQYIRENGGWDNWILIKIHEYKCSSKSELEIEERRMIDMLKPKLNKIIPTRSVKEWREDNKVSIREKDKQYYEANKQFIREKHKEYRKEYYEANKEVINEKNKQTCICDICGSEVNKHHLLRHKKSNKCLSAKK